MAILPIARSGAIGVRLVGFTARVDSQRQDEQSEGQLISSYRRAFVVIALGTVTAVVLTLHHYGFTVNGLGWGAVQLLLGFIAAWDVKTRRILNAVVLPAALIVVAVRAAAVPSALLESLVAGTLALIAFFFLALILRGGLGMGDVKLAGLLGLLLGRAAVGALFAGCVAGGVAAVLLLVSGRAGRKSTFAYGPYLALGGALWVLFGAPPRLV
jgi:leader peptidase (prepilin peptidase)/N-methyltransferase